MKRPHLWVLLALLAMAVLYLGVRTYGEHIMTGAYREYGGAPALGWFLHEEQSEATGQLCRYVAGPNPPWHWNWLGETWQDPYILWEDVQLLSPAPEEIEHNRTGPVRAGDVVCGWARHGTEATIYRPTGQVMTCKSYEPEFDPPCV